MKKILVVIVFLILATTVFFGCTPTKTRQATDEEILISLLDSYKEIPCHTVTGKIFKNNEKYAEVYATTDPNDKKITFLSNDTEYLYYGTFLIKKEDEFVVEKHNTDYAETLNTFFPFIIDNYVYDKNNRGELYLTDNKIIITFLNTGVKNSFSSPLKVSGGVLSISYSNGQITETTLSTTVTENNVSYPLYCHYGYQTAQNNSDSLPWVKPSDTVAYASYVLKTLKNLYPDKTIKVASTKKDTGIGIASIPLSDGIIKKVDTIEIEGGYTNLYIEYSEKQMIIGLNSSVSVFSVTYGKNYDVISISLNEGTRYVLE